MPRIALLLNPILESYRPTATAPLSGLRIRIMRNGPGDSDRYIRFVFIKPICINETKRIVSFLVRQNIRHEDFYNPRKVSFYTHINNVVRIHD